MAQSTSERPRSFPSPTFGCPPLSVLDSIAAGGKLVAVSSLSTNRRRREWQLAYRLGISDDGPLEPRDCLSGRLVLIATAVRNLLRISRPSVANGDDSLHLHFVLLMSGGRVGTSPIRVYSGENLGTKDPVSISLLMTLKFFVASLLGSLAFLSSRAALPNCCAHLAIVVVID